MITDDQCLVMCDDELWWLAMSGSEQQPGNTWVICEDEDGAVNVTVILGFGECLDTLSGDGVGGNAFECCEARVIWHHFHQNIKSQKTLKHSIKSLK